MSSTQHEAAKPWDFSQVLQLINTLDPVNSEARHVPRRPSIPSRATVNGASSLPLSSPMDEFNRTDEGVSLGDFGKIWEYLGATKRTNAPAASKSATSTSPTLQQRMPEKADYTSDGAVYGTPSKRKNIKWRDEENAGDLTDYAPAEDHVTAEQKLTKKQRQKKNKKEREKQAAAADADATKSVSDVDSEIEAHMPRHTPARKAGTHSILDTPTKNIHNSFKSSTKITRSSSPDKSSIATPTKAARSSSPSKTPLKSSSVRSLSENMPNSAPPKTRQAAAMTPQSKVLSQSIGSVQPPQTPDFFKPLNGPSQHQKQWPVSKPFAAKASSLLPSSVQPTRQVSVPAKVADQIVNDTPSKSNRNIIQPKTVRSGDDRNWALLLKIIGDFYEDRASLVSPANMTNHSDDPHGIHVFVDASNIFIGFHDQLKRARGIPQHQYVPRVVLSFDALALLMERRRPVAKRCLVGSKPHMTAFDVAAKVGYECNILDKVKKARELTERQKYFKEQEIRRRNSNGRRTNGNYSAGDSGGSGSETGPAVPSHAPEAFVEQGVDEILHLKMMESIVDTEEPSTIVLATGDAAQAEYSQGFLKMAERALKKGWKVELVSWSANISSQYKKTTWSKQWGDRFRIIYLDDYAEELLDM